MDTQTPLPTPQHLHERMMGCWLGKAVGGTLGQTFEGLEGPLEVDYYYPVPSEMVPNDDLDIQVLYAVVLSQLEQPRVDRDILADSWLKHVEFPWNEYGVGMRNVREGIRPPHSGAFDNWYHNGEGAAIRSELWACLAAGDPDLAVAFAYEDACFDHAEDGLLAAQFLAGMQAHAFVEHDIDVLLDHALQRIPITSGIHRVVTDVRRWVAEDRSWRDVLTLIVDTYANSDFTDVRMNTGFLILGLLAGHTFSERILICNNCGGDTDSTTASLGALLGILDPAGIEDRWLEPIGHDLRLSKEIRGIEAPATLEDLTDMVISLRERIGRTYPAVTTQPFDESDYALDVDIAWMNTLWGRFDIRDHTELPCEGNPDPSPGLDYLGSTLPGTWVRFPRAQFKDRILVLRYRFDVRDHQDVRLMFNCTEHYRVWLDGEFFHAAQGTQFMMPAPHAGLVGQYRDFSTSSGTHELVIAIKRPPAMREQAEWVIALTDQRTEQWIPNAFRPQQETPHNNGGVQ